MVLASLHVMHDSLMCGCLSPCTTRHAPPLGILREWEQAATEAMETISGFVHQLNTLPGVGLLLKNLVNDEAIMATLTPEQQRVAHLHDEEFRLCGTALPEKDRKMMVQLQVDADRYVVGAPIVCYAAWSLLSWRVVVG